MQTNSAMQKGVSPYFDSSKTGFFYGSIVHTETPPTVIIVCLEKQQSQRKQKEGICR